MHMGAIFHLGLVVGVRLLLLPLKHRIPVGMVHVGQEFGEWVPW